MSVCVALTNKGMGCNAMAMNGSDYCYRHNPNISEIEKRQASSSGGRNNITYCSEPISFRKIEDIINLIEDNTNSVRMGNIDSKTSNAVIQNINTLLKVYELAIIDTRVRELEKGAGIPWSDNLLGLGG